MLKCAVCGKIIVNLDPNTVRYGGCGQCPIEEVAKKIEEMKKAEKK